MYNEYVTIKMKTILNETQVYLMSIKDITFVD